jgi:hypothetical protein
LFTTTVVVQFAGVAPTHYYLIRYRAMQKPLGVFGATVKFTICIYTQWLITGVTSVLAV